MTRISFLHAISTHSTLSRSLVGRRTDVIVYETEKPSTKNQSTVRVVFGFRDTINMNRYFTSYSNHQFEMELKHLNGVGGQLKKRRCPTFISSTVSVEWHLRGSTSKRSENEWSVALRLLNSHRFSAAMAVFGEWLPWFRINELNRIIYGMWLVNFLEYFHLCHRFSL